MPFITHCFDSRVRILMMGNIWVQPFTIILFQTSFRNQTFALTVNRLGV